MLTQLGALDGGRLSSRGRKWPRWVTIPAGGDAGGRAGDDEIATAAKLAAILEEPPRGANCDLAQAFSRNQGNWQQRAQQLCKRFNSRGGTPDADSIAPLLAQAFADRIARRRGLDGRYQLANGMGAMLDSDDALTRHEWLIAPLYCRVATRPMPEFCRPWLWISMPSRAPVRSCFSSPTSSSGMMRRVP